MLDNCDETTDIFATGLALSGNRSLAGNPVLDPPQSGGGTARLWRLRDVEADY
ncbi:MAG TPA: hypothetical protein VH593_32880 [Ktedonobacteraceae bacterium]